MIFVTGDTHGDWMSRLRNRSFPEQADMTKEDYVIICGDFGYWHDTSQERHNLDWLESRPFTTLFVDGNHENFDRLYSLPVEKWNGGNIHRVRSSVIHLMRGQVFKICGRTFFAFGGARSHDIQDGILDKSDPLFRQKVLAFKRSPYVAYYRVNHESWWSQEMPSAEEMQEGLDNLRRINRKVDFVITHSPCTSVLRQMLPRYEGMVFEKDELTDYLQKVHDTVDYGVWFFGHMHRNESYPWEKSNCLYEQIVRIA